MVYASIATLLWGMGLGGLILGIGGRIAMRFVAEITTGASGFSVGGTATVIFLGIASGALGALVLLTARRLLGRRPPATSLVYWAFLVAITLRGLRPVDPLRITLFLPLVIGFGILLQWKTWRYRQPVLGTVPG